ncbi:uncharacterized protein LOC133175304 [Saccostrea echinata]|uniref:uncharacterized protein LOC133175304 n=1 Tax=Saccostrea echinata TaxID=191078 RepID=UPI002A81E87D|nr:uncharacterized protein LOC133175304 [Saccostrea echinata]
MLVYTIVSLLVISSINAQNELLHNSDFESSSFSGNWVCGDCTMTSFTSDTYHGRQSVKVTNRKHTYSGPHQTVPISSGQNYVVKTYFKLLNLHPGTMYTSLSLRVNLQVNGKFVHLKVAQQPMQQLKFGWTEISGDFFAPNGTTSATIFLEILSIDVNYLMDSASLQPLQHDSHWISKAHNRINKLRKAPVTIKLAPGQQTHGVYAELIQQKSAFPFGTAVHADKLGNPVYQKYTDFVVKNFEWGVIANMLKWKAVEHRKGHTNYTLAMNALQLLQSRGMQIRGHNMFWDVDKHVPAWLQGMSPSDLVKEMEAHVNDVMSHTRGRLVHWDVNNENLHGDYFERHTRDPDITHKMFQWIHSQDPSIKLFLNDYNILSQSSMTTAIKSQAVNFMKNHVPIGAVGLQSHFHTTDIDMDVLKYRLDKVAEAGLKIWITELTVGAADDNKKAAALENLMTMFFSHPAVEGVILWHFWDGSNWHQDEALFNGPGITPNAAGRKYLDLVHGTWRSHMKRRLDPGHTVNVTAFMGDYVLSVRRNGHVIHNETFSLGSSGKDLTVHLTVYASRNMARFSILYGLLLLVLYSNAETELLKNGDFESTSFSGNWQAADCRVTSYTADKYHGSRSVKISNRHHDWSGVRQDVSLTGGQWYAAKAYIKLLNMPAGVSYVYMEMMAAVHVNGHTKYRTIGQIHMQQEKYGWTEVGGDFFADHGATGATLYVQVHNAAVNYLQDFTSLQRIPTNPNWKSEANARINNTRKAPITVRLVNGASAKGLSVELQQQKSSFGFGAGVVADMMTNHNQQAYQNFVYKNFEWAVIVNALKWRLMEWSKGHINFARPVNAIKALSSHGVKIRGHNMFWGVDGHAPAWLAGKSASEYVSEMKLHVQEVISHTRGTLEHWDVNNENQHGDYFERHTNDPDITAKMFQWIHSAEPGVKLFINEYNVITTHRLQRSVATRNQAIQLRNMGIPVYGVGIQGHFHSGDIDIDVVKYRLDKVAEAGLKIWITELTISESDVNKKATALENLLTLFFSHPAVEGVMFWGFWDGAIHHSVDKLFEGPNLTPNKAGQVYLDLARKAWRTDFTHAISTHSGVHTSGFLGDYVLNVKSNGHVIHQEHFSLDKSGKHLNIHLTDDHQVSHIAFG